MRNITSDRHVMFIVKIKRMDIAMKMEHLYVINTSMTVIVIRTVSQPVIENAISPEHTFVRNTTSGRHVTCIVKIKRMDIAMKMEHLYVINISMAMIAIKGVNRWVIENAISMENTFVRKTISGRHAPFIVKTIHMVIAMKMGRLYAINISMGITAPFTAPTIEMENVIRYEM